MDDLIRLLKTTAEGNFSPDLECLAVATVVNTRGSAYRRPGARMVLQKSLLNKDAVTACGAVSAGCLERDVVANCETFEEGSAEASLGRSETHRPLLLTYDGTSADELVFGLKLGCDGIVQVLIEPAGKSSVYQKRLSKVRPLLADVLSQQKRAVAVTIFDVFDMEGADDVAIEPADTVGLCLLETGKQTHELTPLPKALSTYLRDQARLVLQNKNPHSLVLQENIDGWLVSALLEVVEPITSLLILGGGQDVQPLVEMSEILGWNVVVSDGKWAARGESVPALEVSDFDAAVVMTHDYELDRMILAELVKRDIAYLGIVGPRRRADKLVAELALKGEPITDEKMRRLHSPVGLDIGAERPEEIALSILAEIKAALAGHSGGKLREKQGPIHEPISQPEQALNVGSNDVDAGSVLYKPLASSCAIKISESQPSKRGSEQSR